MEIILIIAKYSCLRDQLEVRVHNDIGYIQTENYLGYSEIVSEFLQALQIVH